MPLNYKHAALSWQIFNTYFYYQRPSQGEKDEKK